MQINVLSQLFIPLHLTLTKIRELTLLTVHGLI